MPVNALAENIFGTLGPAVCCIPGYPHNLISIFFCIATTGAILWTVQLIPQLIKTWRTKSVEGLSPWLV
jgi:hypothetical protein